MHACPQMTAVGCRLSVLGCTSSYAWHTHLLSSCLGTSHHPIYPGLSLLNDTSSHAWRAGNKHKCAPLATLSPRTPALHGCLNTGHSTDECRTPCAVLCCAMSPVRCTSSSCAFRSTPQRMPYGIGTSVTLSAVPAPRRRASLQKHPQPRRSPDGGCARMARGSVWDTPVATVDGVDVGPQHARHEEVGRVLAVVLTGGLRLGVGGIGAVRHERVPRLLARLHCQWHDALPASDTAVG